MPELTEAPQEAKAPAATKSEAKAPQEAKAPAGRVLPQDQKERQIVVLHIKGLSGYAIAKEVFGTSGEEVVAIVREVIEREFPED